MKVELTDKDVLFIYGKFQKELSKIKQIESSPDCPFDKETISDQKGPYLSVIEALSNQVPELAKLDKYF